MIVSSFGRYLPRTAHDHELRARVAIRPEGCFMIMASFGRIATETGHDHAVPYPVGARKEAG
jgi:hypothetical protein